MHSIEWAAGLFEGEGCIDTNKNGLILKMTDLDVVEKFHSVFGVGNIRPILDSHPNHKDQWRWCIYAKSEVVRIVSLMLPYLGNRRAYKALNILDNIELKQ